jgi:AraC-like DNA-binding protein
LCIGITWYELLSQQRSGEEGDWRWENPKLAEKCRVSCRVSLAQLAAVAHHSAYHFAQFKVATGLPPHQYVLTRRVERAKQLVQTGSDFSLAEIAASAGFSDQSQFSHHFKRPVGVTPRQFRRSARIA